MALRHGQQVEKPATATTQEIAEAEVVEATVVETAEPAETSAPVDDIPFENKAVEEAPVQPEPITTAPAVQQPSSSPAVRREGGGQVAQALAAEGYEGITDSGFGLFPMISLKNEGHFESSEGWNLGDSFECQILGVVKKYVIKNTKCEKVDEDTAFSYDMVTEANSGRPVEEIITEWAGKGWGHDVKEYLECRAMIMDGDYAGEPVLISVPPTSKMRLSSVIVRMQMKGKMPHDYVVRCFVGEKVTKVKHPFYPWGFEYVRPAQ